MIPYCLKKYTIDEVPPLHAAVVYFLWHEDECVYVGQTHKIYTRIIQHKTDKLFTRVSYIRIKEKKDMVDVELHYIRSINPFYNLNTVRTPSVLDKFYTFDESARFRCVNRGIKNKRNEDTIKQQFVPEFNRINNNWIEPPKKLFKRKTYSKNYYERESYIKEHFDYTPYFETEEYKEFTQVPFRIIDTNESKLYFMAYMRLADELIERTKKGDISEWLEELKRRFEHHNDIGVTFNLKPILQKAKDTIISVYKLSGDIVPDKVLDFEIKEDIILHGTYK